MNKQCSSALSLCVPIIGRHGPRSGPPTIVPLAAITIRPTPFAGIPPGRCLVYLLSVPSGKRVIGCSELVGASSRTKPAQSESLLTRDREFMEGCQRFRASSGPTSPPFLRSAPQARQVRPQPTITKTTRTWRASPCRARRTSKPPHAPPADPRRMSRTCRRPVRCLRCGPRPL